MTTTRLRWVAAGAAAALAVGGGLASPQGADAAAVHRHATCASKQTFFHAIPKSKRKHLAHPHDANRAVNGLRCTANWDVAIVEAAGPHGRSLYSFEILEHRTGGSWHVTDRAKACEHHRVPRKLHQEVCESD